ncbi:family 1 glycosylhydrolase [Mesoplasma chauliocola]|nr:family 1 glycosylhydrolase [Mesoplasma chauliocola]
MPLEIEDEVKIIGYMARSLIDLVSTHEGITKRYGFVYVNRK